MHFFLNVKEKKICQNFFTVFKCAILKKPKLFSAKWFIIFITHPWKMHFSLYQKKLLPKMLTFFKEKKCFRRAFSSGRNFFSVFNRAPSNTIKKIIKIIYYFFSNNHEKCIWYQFKIFSTKMHWCCQEKEIYSVMHWKINVS